MTGSLGNAILLQLRNGSDAKHWIVGNIWMAWDLYFQSCQQIEVEQMTEDSTLHGGGETMVSKEIVERLGRIFTSTLSNALEDFGEDGVILGLPPVNPGIRMAGRAMCVAQITGPVGTFDGSEFKVGQMIDAASAGDIVVVANNGNPVSSWGGTASYAAKLKGVAGLVVDGGVRDREELIEHEFPVFARHMVPTTGRTRIRVTEIGGEVVISGQKVTTGDIIVADGTGIVCISAAKASEVLAIAVALEADDEQATQEISGGLTFAEAMAKFRKI